MCCFLVLAVPLGVAERVAPPHGAYLTIAPDGERCCPGAFGPGWASWLLGTRAGGCSCGLVAEQTVAEQEQERVRTVERYRAKLAREGWTAAKAERAVRDKFPAVAPPWAGLHPEVRAYLRLLADACGEVRVAGCDFSATPPVPGDKPRTEVRWSTDELADPALPFHFRCLYVITR